jgi:hypothetical protein
MAVKMLTGMAGDDWAVSPGEKFEPNDSAYEARLIAAGLAERWVDEDEAEKPVTKAKKGSK